MSGESLQSAPGITAAAVPGRVVHAQKQPPPLSGSSGSLSQSPGRNQSTMPKFKKCYHLNRKAKKRNSRSNKAAANHDARASSTSSSSPGTLISSEFPELKGWLYKWTNYVRGYQKRWFILSNGLLSYYRTQGEMAYHSRASIALSGASIQVEGSNNFIISNGGGTQTFHLRASNDSEKKRWVNALELSKAKSLSAVANDEDEFESSSDNDPQHEISKQDLINTVKALNAKLEDLSTCADLVGKNGAALNSTINNIKLDKIMESAPPDDRAAVRDFLKSVSERSALLKLTSGAMVKAAADFVHICKTDGKRWTKIMENERELRQKFEDMVEQFAHQHQNLEAQMMREYHLSDPAAVSASSPKNEKDAAQAAAQAEEPLEEETEKTDPDQPDHHRLPHQEVRSVTSNSGSDDDDDFHDAMDEQDEIFTISAPPCYSSPDSSSKKSESDSKEDENSDEEESSHGNQIQIVKKSNKVENSEDREAEEIKQERKNKKSLTARQRRRRVPDRPNISISLWSIVKNSIGKDLTKIPVPVNFSEPLSMLQRLTEDFEYSEILHAAATVEDDCEQMAYVAAFTVSSYSTTAIRSSKPFNPLLGETYEFDRTEDLGFKVISEQVSHHPPMLAQFCESADGSWKCWQEFSMRSKFKGKYLEVEPLGIAHLVFTKSGNHYTWRKVKTVVHNIVIGKLWIDQHGEMTVINHAKNIKCHMKFEPYSYFGGTAKKVTGSVVNEHEKVEWVLNGTWDSKFEASKVIRESVVRGKSTLEIGRDTTRVLWKVNPLDTGADNYYFLTRFACEMNEPEEGIAPTDSRLRPDQRLMENGRWDEANQEKVRLEEKQRAARRVREELANKAAQEGKHLEPYAPTWFSREPDLENGGKFTFVYQGRYWDAKEKQEWAKCPSIF